MAINKINSLALASVAKVNSLAKASITKMVGLLKAAAGFSSNSIAFDGSNDYIETEFTFVNENITYSFWVERGSTAHGKAMMGSKTAIFAGLVFRTHLDVGWGWFFGEDAGGDYWGSNTGDCGFSNGSGWHHIVMTLTYGAEGEGSFHNATATGYMDGVKVVGPYGTGGGSNPKIGSEVPLQLCIGGSPSITDYEGVGAASYFPGNIDDVAFWNTVLTANEIAAIYNNGTPIDISENTGDYESAESLAVWYKMGDGDSYPTISTHAGDGDGTMTNMAEDDIRDSGAIAG